METGDAAWMLMSASLVLLMTPGLAFFYGGMVRGKSVLNMMMMSVGAMGVVGIIWVLWGYAMVAGDNVAGGLLGWSGDLLALNGIMDGEDPLTDLITVGFQVTFAIITVALISGALAERVKFGAWLAFVALWVTVVYFPLAHMVWFGGLLFGDEWFLGGSLPAPIDFAGGTVVHINAGIAALAVVLLIGKRKGFGKEPMRPHNLPFVMLGAALLWFGWFGFNAGSAFGANETAALAWLNTTVATCAALLGWLVTEKIRDGHATSLGAASGIVAGLVAITPAAAAVDPVGAIILGLVAGVLCALAVGLKYRFGYDDSLDVVGVHFVGGLVGTVMIGFLGTDGVGLFFGGGVDQLLTQVIAALFAIVFSFVLTYGIALLIKAVVGWRVAEEAEVGGIDLAEHGEAAYETLGGARVGTTDGGLPVAVPSRPNTEVKA